MSNEEIGISAEDLAGLRTITARGLAHLNSILLRKQRYLRQAEDETTRRRMEIQIREVQEEIRCFPIFMESMIQRVIKK